MLSVEERILLLDEVASTARSSWQILLIGHERFSEFPEEHRQHPAYLGYRNMTNLLSVSLMTACYALIDTNPKTYSFHHAISDKDLQISSTFKEHCDVCFSLKKRFPSIEAMWLLTSTPSELNPIGPKRRASKMRKSMNFFIVLGQPLKSLFETTLNKGWHRLLQCRLETFSLNIAARLPA